MNVFLKVNYFYFLFHQSYEPDAEETCEKCLTEALKFYPSSHDALIQFSNLRILRKRDDEALKHMQIIYDDIISSVQHGDDTNLPSADILLNLSKNFSELTQYIKAIKILDVLIKLDDEDLESWYLLAYNHFLIKNYKHTEKCLKNFKKSALKVSYKTESVQDLESAAKELENELSKIGELKNNNLEESDDEEERIMNSSSNTDEMNID